MINFALPLLGFVAYSGTGKTTLLKQLLPLLRERDVRVGMIKHAHHQFDVDHPGKDSYELRQAGACQMLVASRKRMALITEFEDAHDEPQLEQALAALDTHTLDLVLVEGFKKAAIPKIELYRAVVGKPLMFPDDPNIIAVASDTPLNMSDVTCPQLDLNQPSQFVDFILQHCLSTNNPTQTMAMEKRLC